MPCGRISTYIMKYIDISQIQCKISCLMFLVKFILLVQSTNSPFQYDYMTREPAGRPAEQFILHVCDFEVRVHH